MQEMNIEIKTCDEYYPRKLYNTYQEKKIDVCCHTKPVLLPTSKLIGSFFGL